MPDNAYSHLLRCSRYAARLAVSRPALVDAPPQRWVRSAMQEFLASPACRDEAELDTRLRQLRQRVWLATAARDLNGDAPLAEVTTAFSELAEISIEVALGFHHAVLAARYGEPCDAAGNTQQMVVVAMGKLGGGELNVSSDIDLIYLYPEEGDTEGAKPVSNHEFFVRLARRLTGSLSENAAEGFVFRVDLRLRPWGESGPLAMSYGALEDYLTAHGRPWERYAWIKARAVTGSAHAELDAIVRPFVFRKYLDFGAFAAIRDLHVQIRREVARRELADDVKLGPGGIREIEFTAQVFQLLRGGQLAELRVRPTLAVLARLGGIELLSMDAVTELADAYDFLRRLEHRLQYLDDAQTQRLPDDDASRAMLADALNSPDFAALVQALDAHRHRVTRHFDQAFAAPQADQHAHPLAAVCSGTLAHDAAHALLIDTGYREPETVLHTLDALRTRAARLPESTQLRLNALLPPALEIVGGLAEPDVTLARFAEFIAAIAGRATYLALLVEYPAALRQLARLLGASPWAAQMLTRQPQLLDQLIDPRQLMSPPDWPTVAAQLAVSLDAIPGDLEAQMDALRRVKQVHTLHLLAQDVAGRLTLEALSDHLSYLADLLLNETLKRAWGGLKTRHCETPRFAVIGYGKLGGKELGYASDLDLVFLYDDPDPRAQENYARLAQRLNTWLGTLTPAGVLYEADLRLRPDGASGLLVSSVEAFRDYQTRSAWVWEHQAISRARFVCGYATIGAAFEAIRRDILCAERDADALRTEVLAMRERMHAGHLNDTPLFDLKHDPGGIVDIEFCVQFLILRDCRRAPELADNAGNIALLERAGRAGLVEASIARAAADAYRELRRRQHAIKLAGADHARVPPDDLEDVRRAVRCLWTAVMGTATDAQ